MTAKEITNNPEVLNRMTTVNIQRVRYEIRRSLSQPKLHRLLRQALKASLRADKASQV